MGVLRRLLTAAVAFLAAVAVLPAPAQAHAGLLLVVNDDGRGSVSVDVAWADGHPVTETIAGTVLGSGPGGTQVGPAALTRLPGTSTVVYQGTLAPGSWQVTVDVAMPAIGRCAATVSVAAAGHPAEPGTTRCGSAIVPASATPAGEAGTAWPAWLTVLLIACGAAAVLAVWSWWRHP